MGGRAAAAVADALQQLAVGNAGGDEEHVVRTHEIIRGQHAGQVVPGVEGALALLVVTGPQPALDDAAQALHRTGRDDAFRGATDAEQQVHAGTLAGRHDGARHVPVADEFDPGTGVAHLVDQVRVARPIEDDDGHILGAAPLGLCYGHDVLSDWGRNVDRLGGRGAGDELFHVEHRGRVVHRPAFADREDRDGVVHAFARQGGAVDRVDGHVAFRTVSVADLLAVVEHRRFILLTFADDHDALHGHGADQPAHRVHRSLVGAVLVPPPDPARCRHRGRLRDPDQLQGKVAVRRLSAHGQRVRDGATLGSGWNGMRSLLIWHGGLLVSSHASQDVSPLVLTYPG